MNRNLLTLAASALFVTGLAGCSASSAAASTTTSGPEAEAAEPAATASAESTVEASAETGASSAVFYFSASSSKTTKGVAEKLAEAENADLYEIVPAEIYTAEDLDWNNDQSRTTVEQNDDSARPAIAGEPVDISGYDTIYVGYPIWWGIEPRIMDTFVETYDFADSTVIPFATSGGSGMGSSDNNLEELAGSGNWKEGEVLRSSASIEDLKSWADSVN